MLNIFFALIFFIALIGISYYYITKRQWLSGKIGLVLISYVMGLLISVVFFLNNIYDFVMYTIIIGMIYYILITKLSGLIQFSKESVRQDFQKFDDIELINELIKIWNIPINKLRIRIYKGSNAFRKISVKFIDVYVGDGLIKAIKREELKFVLSHEIAHTRSKIYMTFPVIFLIIYSLFLYIICNELIINHFLNIQVFFLVTIVLYIFGIMIFNYVLWGIEYKADKLGFLKTQDRENSISLLQKFVQYQPNHGLVLNLIFYDHPQPEDRINRIKNINLT
jgi:Zn-dependent protease with chaperone function